MDQTLSKLNEYLVSKKSIGVVTPKDPTLDQMAAALSLYLSLQASGRNVSIATPNSPLVELSSLFGIDKVKTELGTASGDLVVSFPYKEGEIEKVSYTLEDGFLNIVVKAGEAGFSFDQKDVKYQRPTASIDLLFIVGASRVSDLGKLFDPASLKETAVVNIDNNPQNQGFGDIVMVSTRSSSISEQIANILLAMNLPVDPDIAQNLLDGILSATNNFQSPNTSALSLEMAGVLMKSGAKRVSETRERATTAFSRPYTPVSEIPSAPAQTSAPLESQQFEPMPVREPVSSVQSPISDQTLNNPPSDWLTPKIYKGSTNF